MSAILDYLSSAFPASSPLPISATTANRSIKTDSETSYVGPLARGKL